VIEDHERILSLMPLAQGPALGIGLPRFAQRRGAQAVLRRGDGRPEAFTAVGALLRHSDVSWHARRS